MITQNVGTVKRPQKSTEDRAESSSRVFHGAGRHSEKGHVPCHREERALFASDEAIPTWAEGIAVDARGRLHPHNDLRRR